MIHFLSVTFSLKFLANCIFLASEAETVAEEVDRKEEVFNKSRGSLIFIWNL